MRIMPSFSTQPRVICCVLACSVAWLIACGETDRADSPDNHAGAPSIDEPGNDGGSGGESGDTTKISPFASVFDESTLPRFDITLSEQCLSALETTPDQYCAGDLRYRDNLSDDLSFAQVGVRLKGSASFRPLSEKPSFKIKLDEFVKQRLHGLRRITLNSMGQDPSMIREVLGYQFYRKAMEIAPLCNEAEVYLNETFYGLYANVQTLDDEFVQNLFTKEVGNLYDTTKGSSADVVPAGIGAFQLETNKSANDTSDLASLIAAASEPISTFYTDVGQVLDWKEVLAAGAAQAIIADWDGYFGGSNNYKLYHELTRDRFVMLPWGIDQTFGVTADVPDDPLAKLNYSIDGTNSGRTMGTLFVKCQMDPSCWSDYLDAVEAAVTVFEGMDLIESATSIRQLNYDAATRDERKAYSNDVVEQHIAAVKTFIEQRPALVRADIERLRQTTTNAPGGPDGYTFCAYEGGNCSFSGTLAVAYGAKGTYTYLTATDGISCDNTTFGGDPLPGVAKACFVPQSQSD
jgi:hypothetical protein